MAITLPALLAGTGVVLSRGPWNARVAIDAARELLEKGRSPGDARVQALARGALRRDVTLPAAIELVALGDEARGRQAEAARLFHLSDRISRRSLATRLWLVQDAVDRGDVKAALAEMDIALRTSDAAPAIVFPALARGLDDTRLVGPIAALSDRPSDWREAFMIYVAEHAEPRSAAALLRASRNRELIARDELDRKVIVRLSERGQFLLARDIDAAFSGRREPAPLLADGRFDEADARYPFGWSLGDAANLGATRDVENGRTVLAYHANVAEGGQVAAQLLTLPAGTYRLETETVRADASPVPPSWVLVCAGTGHPIATLAVPAAAATSRTSFAVPADCSAQWLTLALRPALAPQAGALGAVNIEPARRGQAQ